MDYQSCLLRAFGEKEYSDAVSQKVQALYLIVKDEPGIQALMAEVRAANAALDEPAAFCVLFSYDYLARTFAVLKNC